MMINYIKQQVENNLNIDKKFIFHGSRNQIEEFTGMISAMYHAVFVITIEHNKIRTFSYSDLLIGNLEIID